ncbi:hypothetical protein ACLOJK_025061 [Asimina triloba]
MTSTLRLFSISPAAAASFLFRSHGVRRSFSSCSRILCVRGSKQERKRAAAAAAAAESLVKRRTRSGREFDQEDVLRRHISEGSHVPVLLGEVLDVFDRQHLRSFVDCTVGAAGHSSAFGVFNLFASIRDTGGSNAYLYVGLDIDPIAHAKAQPRIDAVLHNDSSPASSDLKTHTFLKNFRYIKSVLGEIDEDLPGGVDGILMDLGMSSMQVNDAERGFSMLNDGPLDMRMDPRGILKAEDILNFWPEDELGRILREYGEESNWRSLQTKILKARLDGGLHSTGELVQLVQGTSGKSSGRQGWIKTATRVFQALRIAVNDELRVLEDAIHACFDCLSSQGRLAVISFHSLEDRIVKQTFLDIINQGDGVEGRRSPQGMKEEDVDAVSGEEIWTKHRIEGRRGTILTKRPITPSEEEEKLNHRCRSAKLRVIQKA